MEVTTEYLGKRKFAVMARGHRLICDQPLDNRGEDEGMTPPELMLGSLGACAGYYVTEYLNTRGWPSENVVVRVTADKLSQPARLGSFRIDVLTSDLDEQQRLGVSRAVKACLIHNTLLSSPSIEIDVHAAVTA